MRTIRGKQQDFDPFSRIETLFRDSMRPSQIWKGVRACACECVSVCAPMFVCVKMRVWVSSRNDQFRMKGFFTFVFFWERGGIFLSIIYPPCPLPPSTLKRVYNRRGVNLALPYIHMCVPVLCTQYKLLYSSRAWPLEAKYKYKYVYARCRSVGIWTTKANMAQIINDVNIVRTISPNEYDTALHVVKKVSENQWLAHVVIL